METKICKKVLDYSFNFVLGIFQHSISNNVVGCFKNSNALFKIIFTAHYDTAFSGPLWETKTVAKFRLNFLIGLSIIIILQIILILKLLSIDAFLLKTMAYLLVYILLEILL